MTSDVVWVSPSARVKTAVILMKGHSIGALPVVETNEAVVGLVTYQSLLGEPQDAAVMDVMDRGFTTVDPSTSAYDAAQLMIDAKASHLIVMENGKMVGIVSRADLMPELGKNFDPLTNMPWSDALRENAMRLLKGGQEISITLFDLDGFGSFNKKYGHVIGDKVIQSVADVIKSGVDPELELAVRYAGDEFGIVSVRHADDARALAEELRRRVSEIRIEGVPDPVTVTFGVFGGRRTKEREDMHYAATIDDLITIASKECTAHKPSRKAEAKEAAPAEAAPVGAAQPVAEIARGPRLKIGTISLTTTGAEATVSVTLTRGDQMFQREAAGYVIGGTNILRLVAEATSGAACKSIAPGHGIVVDEVITHGTGKEDQIVTVVAVFISPRYTTRHVGSAVVKRGDQYRAAAAALLSAVNRQLENAPQAEIGQSEDEPA